MSCETVRESISAMLDGEEPPLELPAQEHHLSMCPACREWQAAAHDVTRRFRLVPAETSEAPLRPLIDAVLASKAPPRWAMSAALPRLALMIAAALQVALSLPFLEEHHAHGPAGHVSHELASFGLALAIAFLIAAWRPGRAPGIGSAVGAVALLLVITGVMDVASGHATPLDESMHLLAVVGWLLLRWLAKVTPPDFGSTHRSLPSRLRLAWRSLRATPDEFADHVSTRWTPRSGPAAYESEQPRRRHVA
jgi:predicted anti-sigma-YlaC factor YlaD